jgi:BirA family biotin operon repressor/biotin-[acetyl-CoA-carboxylase] ligase
VLARVAAPLVKALLEFDAHGFAPFAERFAARDLLRGRAITTTQSNLPGGVARGVSPTGTLLVQTDDGLREVSSGEVSVRLKRSAMAADEGPPSC